MTIKVGDKVPTVTLRQQTAEGVKEVTTDELFAGKKVAVFAVPGAFTRTCSQRYSMLVDNGVVKALNVEKPGEFAVSNAETMLGQL